MHKGVNSWKNLLKFVIYFFSIPQLLGSLFTPWQGDSFSSTSSSVGERFIQNFVFQLLTRVFGFLIRIIVVVLGIIAIVFVLTLFPLFVILPINLVYERMVRAGSWGKSWSYPMTSFLNKHARELRTVSIDYFPHSRESVIEQIDRVLAREKQANVILVGEQGVGKTSVLAEFARRVYWGLVHPQLDYKRVVQLIVDELSDDDIKRAIDEAVHAKNIILVIENIHLHEAMLGFLVPYFSTPGFQTIISTDFDNFHATLKYNNELMQIAEKVEVLPPTTEETKMILIEYIARNSRRVKLEDGVIDNLVHYTDTLMQHMPQPEKSIDILDELLSSEKFITKEILYRVISQKTNVPVGNITRDESQFLLSLEDKMKEKIIGQHEAIEQVVRALKRSRSGIGSKDRPMGVFLFMGPTGVGKTYTAQMLAKFYFGSKDTMIRFDMSEFRELDTLSSFIKRAADAIEAKPFSLFFIDEIEKAHPDILNVFLQIFDEGRLTMENGRTVSFNNSIIIATTNAGTDFLQENPNIPKERLVERIISEGIFRPEFLNRFDAITLFKPLSEDEIHAVTKLLLSSIAENLQHEKNITLTISDAFVQKIAQAGFDPKFGARPIRRAAQELVEDVVADKLLRGEVGPGQTITLE